MITDILKYGGLGLGLALAFLSYKLIATEQRKDKPNKNIMFLTYGFFILSIVVSGMGFVSERKELEELKKENEKLSMQIAIFQSSINKLKETNSKFESIKHTIDTLLDIKGSLINKSETIQQVKSQLILIQDAIKKELHIDKK